MDTQPLTEVVDIRSLTIAWMIASEGSWAMAKYLQPERCFTYEPKVPTAHNRAVMDSAT